MKNFLISLAVALAILCAIGVVYVFYAGEGGNVLQPDKKGASDTAVVSDENKTTEHQVMKPVLPSDDNEQNGEEPETTKTEADEPNTNPNEKN